MGTPTKQPTKQLLAFTWYREADYSLLLEASRNMKGLAEDYQSWLKDAREALQKYKDLGFEPYRIYIEVQEYLDWCESRDRAINKPSREMFKEIRRQEFYRALDKLEADEGQLDKKELEVLGFELVEGVLE